MKQIFFLFMALGSYVVAIAQNPLSRHTFSNGGRTHSSLNFSIGETFSGTTAPLTMGSQQHAGVVTIVVAPITGPGSVCASQTIPLANATPGGVWSSTNTAKATVSTGGIVTGIAGGTTTISYTVGSGAGAVAATTIITVNPLATAGVISGPATICEGANVTFTASGTGGGSWSSTNTGAATVSAGGIVSAISPGATTLSYTVSNGCGTVAATKAVTVSATANPGSISGTATVCAGSTTPLTASGSGGGIWSSSFNPVAMVNASGIVTGVAAGTATISYTISGSCGSASAIQVVTVNPIPNPGVVIGASAVCPGSTINLTSSGMTGGSWSSTNAAAATISAAGEVAGIAAGNTSISYTITHGCGTAAATKFITVNALPTPGTVNGATAFCQGTGIILTSSGTTGGTWSSANNAVASVSATGTVTGIAGGNAIIAYTVTNGCGSIAATAVVTVNPLAAPGIISGMATICPGATTTLAASGTGGGSWSSSNNSVATVSGTGSVAGVSGGTATISYTVTNGCGSVTASKVVTVNPSADPGVLSGSTNICAGTNAILTTNGTNGGVWSSTNTAAATISATGTVTGITNGSTIIMYTVTNGCGSVTSSVNVVVNPQPADPGVITGPASVCEGSNILLTGTGTGGVWSSSIPSRATVNSGGVVTGVSSGGVNILYTTTNSCGSLTATFSLVVNPTPAAISGGLSVCPGALTTLTTSPAGGLWSSPHATVTVIASNGKVTGVTPGTAQINYTLSTGCSTTTTVTVTPPPGAISGVLSVCPGATTTLIPAGGGGTWSNSSAAQATIDAGTGVATGVSSGITIVTYTASAGCFTTSVLTVNAAPQPITGILTLCPGTTTDLNSATPGGVWSSGAPAITTVNAITGLVTSVAGTGTAPIMYTVGSLCPLTVNVTVAVPSPNTGIGRVCLGQPVSVAILQNATPGGVWSSSSELKAKINATTGLVKGISLGTVVISYSLGAGCVSTTVVTVAPAVSSITGVTAICPGTTTTLVNSTPGGTWSSNNTAIATTTPGGAVTGLSGGSTSVTYMVTAGCYKSTNFTVYGAMSPIAGLDVICQGSASMLSSSPAGGTWSSSNTAVATVNSTGAVTGKLAGTSIITYKLGSSGCFVTKTVTVTAALPLITGSSSVCPGTTADLDNSTGGGAWSSSNISKATIDAISGVVTGISSGTATITYMTTSACYRTVVQTILPAPAPIMGSSTVCEGATIALSSSSGGTWSSSNPGNATISTTGMLTGIAVGSTTIAYQLATGCITTTNVMVNETPDAITGTMSVCTGASVALTSLPAGGAWTSSNSIKASVNAGTGEVTGLTVGSVYITYTLATGCYKNAVMNVNISPAPITGVTTLAVAAIATLSSSPTGGVWSSLSPSTATIVATTGSVTGVSAGVTTIRYQLSTGCFAEHDITIGSSRPEVPDENTVGGTDLTFVKIYPNPTFGTLTIEASVTGTFAMYTIDGKLIAQYELKEATTALSLPGNLAAGVYMCRFLGDDGTSKMVRLVYQP